MAKKKNLTDRQKRIRRRRRKSTMSRVVFALEIIILVRSDGRTVCICETRKYEL